MAFRSCEGRDWRALELHRGQGRVLWEKHQVWWLFGVGVHLCAHNRSVCVCSVVSDALRTHGL